MQTDDDNTLVIGKNQLVRINCGTGDDVSTIKEARKNSVSAKRRIGANMMREDGKKGILNPGIEGRELRSGD